MKRVRAFHCFPLKFLFEAFSAPPNTTLAWRRDDAYNVRGIALKAASELFAARFQPEMESANKFW
jgi:hypothetical protein